jgi:hypothetical protein
MLPASLSRCIAMQNLQVQNNFLSGEIALRTGISCEGFHQMQCMMRTSLDVTRLQSGVQCDFAMIRPCVMPCCFISYHAIPYHVMPCHGILCPMMRCDAM